MYGYVYKTTNLINGKKYIGKHKSEYFDPEYKGSGTLLWNAISKYGWDNFESELLVECNSSDELNSEEIRLIAKYDAVKSDLYYNILPGGDGGWAQESGENNSFYGHKHTEETRKKMSESHTGERNHNYGKDLSGKNHPCYGKHYSEEHRKHISESLIGRKLSDETKKKIGDANRGKILSENTKKLISESKIGKNNPMYRTISPFRNKHHSEESKKKISDSIEGRKFINNGTVNKQVRPEDLDWYLSNGWSLGMIRKKRIN